MECILSHTSLHRRQDMANEAVRISLESAELVNKLKAINGELLRPELLKVVRVGAKDFRKAIVSRAPQRSMALKKALRVRAHKGKNDRSWASVGVGFGKKTYKYKGKLVPPFYAIMVHNGTVVGADGKRIRFKTYKSKAYDGWSELQKARQMQNDRERAQSRQRIKPNYFMYDAFMAAFDKAAKATLDAAYNKIMSK